jgi:hypothetical protein
MRSVFADEDSAAEKPHLRLIFDETSCVLELLQESDDAQLLEIRATFGVKNHHVQMLNKFE